MLKSARAFANTVFCLFWTFLCFFPATLALCLGRRGWYSHQVVRHLWVRGMLWFCGIKVVASGVENSTAALPCVFASNHQSLFDIPAVFHATAVNLRFVAKKSLFYIPFFGPYLALAGYISVDRKNRERAIRSLDGAAEKIRRGIPIISFPEGTRSPDGAVQRFKKGAFMLALKAGVPVVPVSISGSNRVLPKKTWLVRPGTIRIHFAPPVDTASFGMERRDELMEEVRNIILQNKKLLDEGRECL